MLYIYIYIIYIRRVFNDRIMFIRNSGQGAEYIYKNLPHICFMSNIWILYGITYLWNEPNRYDCLSVGRSGWPAGWLVWAMYICQATKTCPHSKPSNHYLILFFSNLFPPLVWCLCRLVCCLVVFSVIHRV